MIEIKELTLSEMDPAYEVFRQSIPDAFELEGLAALTEEIRQEIEGKRRMLHDALFTEGSSGPISCRLHGREHCRHHFIRALQ